MRSIISLVSVALASLTLFGCSSSQPSLTLSVPKGWPAPHKLVLGTWEGQIKQKLALGEAAEAEMRRIPYAAAADVPSPLPHVTLVATHPQARIPLKAAADGTPTNVARLTPSPAKPTHLARAHVLRSRRTISCKSCRIKKARHTPVLARR